MDPLSDVLGLLTAWVLGVGPVVGSLTLLNRRDRRQAALARLAYRQLDAEALGGEVAVEARCGLLGGAGRVTVDMRSSSREAVWDAVARLRRGLPAPVRLTVLGPVGPARPARITVDWPEPDGWPAASASWPPSTRVVTTR
jgi:hypothetical protein